MDTDRIYVHRGFREGPVARNLDRIFLALHTDVSDKYLLAILDACKEVTTNVTEERDQNVVVVKITTDEPHEETRKTFGDSIKNIDGQEYCVITDRMWTDSETGKYRRTNLIEVYLKPSNQATIVPVLRKDDGKLKTFYMIVRRDGWYCQNDGQWSTYKWGETYYAKSIRALRQFARKHGILLVDD